MKRVQNWTNSEHEKRHSQWYMQVRCAAFLSLLLSLAVALGSFRNFSYQVLVSKLTLFAYVA